MKAIVFDTSTIISIAMNNLLNILKELKQKTRIEFYITHSIKQELVDKALKSKKYRLEGLQILRLINENIITIYKDRRFDQESHHLLNKANTLFKAKNSWIKLVDKPEVDAFNLAIYLKATLAIDERNLRLLIESPRKLKQLLEKKLNTKVEYNKDNLEYFEELNIPIIRSTEMMYVAYEKDLLKNLIPSPEYEDDLISGLLWGLRLRGCAISTEEIDQILKIN